MIANVYLGFTFGRGCDTHQLHHSSLKLRMASHKEILEECPSVATRLRRRTSKTIWRRMYKNKYCILVFILLIEQHMFMYYAYLLKLSNGDYYAGSTQDMLKRFEKHKNGEVPHTSKFRPLALVWYGAFENKQTAVRFEDYLKTASGKAFRNKRLV